MTEEVSKELSDVREALIEFEGYDKHGGTDDTLTAARILARTVRAELASRSHTGSYVSFEDWFHELEGFSLRSERAEGDIAWLRAAFDAGRSPTEARGEVKALEWESVSSKIWDARALGGLYRVKQADDETWTAFKYGDTFRADRATADEAKAAAQADYEKRILSALSHPPAREAVDANALWEMLFAITRDDVPEGMTDEVLAQLAESINAALQVKP